MKKIGIKILYETEMMKPFFLFLLVLLLSNIILSQTIIDSGLVAFYPFNSNALDESGNGNDAVVYGATLTSDRFGISNSAYLFNGIDNYLEALNTSLPIVSESRTVCFWLKSLQDTASTIINFGMIEASDTSTIFNVFYKNGCVSSYTLLGGFGGWASNDNHWYHEAVVFEDTTSYILYQDGQQNVMGWGPGVKLNTIGTSMRIGAPLSSVQNQNFFAGVIDDIRIYNRALTGLEIDSLYRENEWVDVSELTTCNPNSFMLNQNYPNPFNPSTKIRYEIPLSPPLLKGESVAGGFVTLKVYDVLGNEVATLVNEYRPAGAYNVEFTINNLQLSSGIYFYRLQAGDPSTGSGQVYVETKKMIILK